MFHPTDDLRIAFAVCQVKLKGRFKIRRLSVRIADAHGRFVRTIRLHYHTKPVANLNDLKLPENVAKWRLAGTVEVKVSS